MSNYRTTTVYQLKGVARHIQTETGWSSLHRCEKALMITSKDRRRYVRNIHLLSAWRVLVHTSTFLPGVVRVTTGLRIDIVRAAIMIPHVVVAAATEHREPAEQCSQRVLFTEVEPRRTRPNAS
jgi:hypothetical protein